MLTPEQRERVMAIYAAADAAVAAAGPRCDASGRCCRFAEYGHTLFVSQLEADVLLAAAPAYDGPVSADVCPFQVDNLCTAREPRPLGCRVYFCDPAYQDEGQRISETYLRQLKDLADELGVGWRYAPLHAFLGEALDRSKTLGSADPARTPGSEDSTRGSTRITPDGVPDPAVEPGGWRSRAPGGVFGTRGSDAARVALPLVE